MTIADTVYRHVKTMPLPLAQEVLDFIEFLNSKQSAPRETLSGKNDRQCRENSIASFRGKGKGGSVQRLLAERRRDEPGNRL